MLRVWKHPCNAGSHAHSLTEDVHNVTSQVLERQPATSQLLGTKLTRMLRAMGTLLFVTRSARSMASRSCPSLSSSRTHWSFSVTCWQVTWFSLLLLLALLWLWTASSSGRSRRCGTSGVASRAPVLHWLSPLQPQNSISDDQELQFRAMLSRKIIYFVGRAQFMFKRRKYWGSSSTHTWQFFQGNS